MDFGKDVSSIISKSNGFHGLRCLIAVNCQISARDNQLLSCWIWCLTYHVNKRILNTILSSAGSQCRPMRVHVMTLGMLRMHITETLGILWSFWTAAILQQCFQIENRLVTHLWQVEVEYMFTITTYALDETLIAHPTKTGQIYSLRALFANKWYDICLGGCDVM